MGRTIKPLALVILVALTLWLFAAGYYPFAILPALGVWALFRHSKQHDTVDQLYVGGIVISGLALGAALLKGFFGI